ncbi:hypothetical protein EAP82_05435 [Salmonella enterica]|uniref:hypothetical protein n=1 Tax=Salmonella enterica TaxID=28901 RepID=UPI0009A9BB1D|nr:hypothetical protein [Salmonella enterica]EBS2194170.1 hypothetical protein [Salmonella enterica subsp. enterica serovar Thompson]EDC7350211.1 hypothetical protein [Salmonella enterica subsp. enterica serovar Enteritidis]EDU2337163.1 hypothetical protein [Salmonella enterica subsp. enterica serovar Saintpaul]HCM6286049.1 hypothetical protein [Salmonella enterica subsp. enterica serovar -:k:-]EAP3673644.1 hypothetical protein [Salmonella enterica]
MSNFFVTMTPEQWARLKNRPQNFPIVEDYFPAQPEPGDMLFVRQQLPRSPYDDETIIDLGQCVIAWAEPVANIPHRYRLKVTFNMTPEQVKQRYGCRCTKLSSILCRHKEQEAEKERAKWERKRQVLAHKAETAARYLKK